MFLYIRFLLILFTFFLSDKIHWHVRFMLFTRHNNWFYNWSYSFFRNMNNMKGFLSQAHLALNAHFNAQFAGIVQEIESLVGSYCHMILSIYAFISNRKCIFGNKSSMKECWENWHSLLNEQYHTCIIFLHSTI